MAGKVKVGTRVRKNPFATKIDSRLPDIQIRHTLNGKKVISSRSYDEILKKINLKNAVKILNELEKIKEEKGIEFIARFDSSRLTEKSIPINNFIKQCIDTARTRRNNNGKTRKITEQKIDIAKFKSAPQLLDSLIVFNPKDRRINKLSKQLSKKQAATSVSKKINALKKRKPSEEIKKEIQRLRDILNKINAQ